MNSPGRAVRLLPIVTVKAGRPIESASGPAKVLRGTAGAAETIIRSHPDQWYMFRRMWPQPARPPPGAAKRALERPAAHQPLSPEAAGAP